MMNRLGMFDLHYCDKPASWVLLLDYVGNAGPPASSCPTWETAAAGRQAQQRTPAKFLEKKYAR